MTKEKMLTYHQSLAEALAEAMRKPKFDRNPRKISRIIREIKRSGKELQKFPEEGEFPDSENPGRTNVSKGKRSPSINSLMNNHVRK